MQIVLGVIALLFFIFAITVFTGAPYVPSAEKELDYLFGDLVKIGKKDCVVDFGSGDGIVLKVATKYGAKAVGIEINPILVLISKWRLRKNPRATTKWRSFVAYDFPPETTVVYLFGESRDIKLMARQIKAQAQRIGHDLILVSQAFQIPDMKPIKTGRAFFVYKITKE